MFAILKCLIVPTTYFTTNPALEPTENKLLTIKMSTKQITGIKYGNLKKVMDNRFTFNEQKKCPKFVA